MKNKQQKKCEEVFLFEIHEFLQQYYSIKLKYFYRFHANQSGFAYVIEYIAKRESNNFVCF